MKLVRRNLLYYTRGGVQPTPPSIEYLHIGPGVSYTLDYTITTGEELGIADIAYTLDYSTISAKSGWSRMIGAYVNSSNKWYLGCYKGGSINPGTQYGSGGDRTLNINDSTAYDTIKARSLWWYGKGYILVKNTPGNWVEGEYVGSSTQIAIYSWASIIGEHIKVGGLDTQWENEYNFYGLRIYSSGTANGSGALMTVTPGTLLAEYVPYAEGVIKNTVSGNLIYAS